MKEKPLVSVVIPTKNSAGYLEQCLLSIKNQTYQNIEIIVVDNYSTDETLMIAKRYADKILQTGPERSAQVNRGIEVANGKYVYRVDSDFVLTPTVVAEAVHACEDCGFDAVLIHNTSDATVGFWAKVRKLERDCYRDDDVNVAARFFRKEVVEQVGGFDEDVVFFEEATLPHKIEKLGYNVKRRIKSEILHHEEDFSLRKWLKKKYYYGKSAWKYVRRYSQRGNKQVNPMRRFGLFLKNKRFHSKPFLAIGVITLKSLEYELAGFGYLAGRVKRKK